MIFIMLTILEVLLGIETKMGLKCQVEFNIGIYRKELVRSGLIREERNKVSKS